MQATKSSFSDFDIDIDRDCVMKRDGVSLVARSVTTGLELFFDYT